MKAGLLAGLVVLTGVLAPPASGDSVLDLGRYRWRQRVLVLSAPDAQDARLVAMRRGLRAQACGVAERDLVVLEIVGGAGFVVRLVGKDGGDKLRREAPVPVEEIFTLIDAMPMRQDERRRRPGAC